MYITQLKKKQMDELVRIWKRADDICDDYIVRGDIWIPAVRTPKSRPGRHMIQGPPCPPELQTIIYSAKNLPIKTKTLSEKKGLKSIQWCYDRDTMGFVLNTAETIMIATAMEKQGSFPCEWLTFEELEKDLNWNPVTTKQLEDVRDGDRVELDDGTYHVIIARSHFKYSGVVSTSKEVTHKAKFAILPPADNGIAMLYILVDYDFFRCCHTYPFRPYTKPDYSTISY